MRGRNRVTVFLPDDLRHDAYMAVVLDTVIEGDVDLVRFRFGTSAFFVEKSRSGEVTTLEVE